MVIVMFALSFNILKIFVVEVYMTIMILITRVVQSKM